MDCVLVPHEQVIDVKSMNVCLMSETVEYFSLNDCEKIPDHFVLTWEVEPLKYNHSDVHLHSTETPLTSETIPTARQLIT